MYINAKASLGFEELADKINKGAENIEIQLINEFAELNTALSTEVRYFFDERYIEAVLDGKCTITAIHMPLSESSCYDIEYGYSRKTLYKVAEMAQFFANIQHNNVLVVVHISEDLKKLVDYGVYDKIKTCVDEVLTKYPDIELGFENTTLIGIDWDRNSFDTCSAFSLIHGEATFTNIELVKALNNPRCGVVADTCHAMLLQNLLNLMASYYGDGFKIPDIMEEMFKQSSPYIKLVHLNKAILHGLGKYHGLPFYKENPVDVDLEKIARLYCRYGNNCMISLEVREDDYCNSVNFVATKEALEDVLKSIK